MNFTDVDPVILARIKVALEAAGFYPVEGDDDYELWSFNLEPDDCNKFIDLRITVEGEA